MPRLIAREKFVGRSRCWPMQARGRPQWNVMVTDVKIAATERLLVRWLNVGDAAFILELVNDPSWIQFIDDKGVRTLDDAQRYIQNGPLEMCERLGFGLYLVELK